LQHAVLLHCYETMGRHRRRAEHGECVRGGGESPWRQNLLLGILVGVVVGQVLGTKVLWYKGSGLPLVEE
jgi:hypothetical protein